MGYWVTFLQLHRKIVSKAVYLSSLKKYDELQGHAAFKRIVSVFYHRTHSIFIVITITRCSPWITLILTMVKHRPVEFPHLLWVCHNSYQHRWHIHSKLVLAIFRLKFFFLSNEFKWKSDRTKLIKGWLFGWCGNGATHAYSKPYNFEKFPKDVPKRSTKGGHRENKALNMDNSCHWIQRKKQA